MSELVINHNKVIAHLLKENEGLGLGEVHWTNGIPHFLLSSLLLLKRLGIRTIYSEALRACDNGIVEEFYKNPSAENKQKLKQCFTFAASKSWPVIISSSRHLGIRFVGLNIDRTTETGQDIPNFEIHKLWANQIKEDRALHPEGKFLFHSGLSHQKSDFSDDEAPPSVPATLGIPFISLYSDNGFLSFMDDETAELSGMMGRSIIMGLQDTEVVTGVPENSAKWGVIHLYISPKFSVMSKKQASVRFFNHKPHAGAQRV